MKFLRSNLFAALLGVILYFAITAMLLVKIPPPAPKARETHHEGEEANTSGASWQFHNPEMDQLIDELKRERDELTAREQQLKELESRIRSERAELEEATRSVKKMQTELDRDVVKLKDDEAVNLKRLAKMYSTMEPPGAAAILRELEDGVVVKILTLMKEAETGPILDALAKRSPADTQRAARISEMLRLAAANKAAAKK